MRKIFLRAFCLVFVLTLCLPMVACDLSNMQFGGLVGELMADNAKDDTIGELENDLVIEDVFPDIQTAVDSYIEDYTYPVTEEPYVEPPMPDTTEAPSVDGTTEPPTTDAPLPDPITFFSFDECYALIGDDRVHQLFTPGQHASWDGIAIIEDCNVEYVSVRGWVAFSAAQIGEIGYCIDYDTYEFNNAFFTDTEQPVIDAALAMGAQSASRIEILIPVRQLSGEHVIEIVAKDENDYLEIIGTFKLDKAVDPYAPLFVFDAYAIADSLYSNAHDVVCSGVSEGGSYVTLTCPEGMDPYFNPISYTPAAYTNVKYIVLAYRTTVADQFGEFFVGSDVGPRGGTDEAKFDYVADGAWHTYVLDLSKVESINDSFDLSYLRYDIYPSCEPGQSIDIAYIAGFDSMEDVMIFQSQNKLG